MKRRLLNFVFAIPVFSILLLFCFCFVMLLAGQRVYLPPVTSKEIFCYGFCLLVLLGILCAGVAGCLHTKKWYCALGEAILLLVILFAVGIVMLAGVAFGTSSSTYQRFDSPDGACSLVFEREYFFPHHETGTVYIMTSPITMKKVAQLERPFYPPLHQLNWCDGYVEIILQEEVVRIQINS